MDTSDLVKQQDGPVLDVRSSGEVKIRVGDEEKNPASPNTQSANVYSSTVTISGKGKKRSTAHQKHSAHVELAIPSPESHQFAIEQCHKNTDSNPYKESTSVTPYFVRKAHSYEILPKPFRTTNQFICVAYLSFLCCCCFGAFAAKWAWEAKIQRNKGLYNVARKSAKRALWLMIAACVGGLIIMTILLAVFV